MKHTLSRRQFLQVVGGVAVIPVTSCDLLGAANSKDQTRKQGPNVIVILSDDQGYGDFSCHGNPIIKTPNLDKLHSEAIRLTDFHVAPICTPTRSQIMTGQDALANGAYCVCSGHEFIHEGIPTMADVFAGEGYRTGLFGKWHLGDNYPYRPQDRGFNEVLSFGGWGLTSTSAYWNNEYMDPMLMHNGKLRRTKGYCTDIYFDEAMKWVENCRKQQLPFFVYLATNTPHGPLQVPEKYSSKYKKRKGANFYGMIDNLDENVGKLDKFLKQKGLYDNTIIIYMNDNGATAGKVSYNAGMKGGKATYYDGGHRAACFIRWPAKLKSGDVDALTETQDLLPSLIDLCKIKNPVNAKFDGTSISQLLQGKDQPELKERMLVVQTSLWEEYEGPNKWQAAVLWNKWRLVKGDELYDISTDPGQENNVAFKHADVVRKMRQHYEKWWGRVEDKAKEFPPIHLGNSKEPQTVLTAHNWVAPNTANHDWIRDGVNQNGPWHVYVANAGFYEIALRRWPIESDLPLTAFAPVYKGKLANYPEGKSLSIWEARLKIAEVNETRRIESNEKAAVFKVNLPAGRATLQTWFYDAAGKELCGAYYVYVKQIS